MIDGTKWDFFHERKTTVTGHDSFFFGPFFAKAFTNAIKSLNL